MIALWLSIFTVSVILALPVVLAIMLRHRWRVPWLYFIVGVLTFLGAQAIHLPLNKLLANLGILPEGAASGSSLIQLAIIAGLTAGLTEELARTVGYALVHRARKFEDGVMMGLGHGGIEAMIVAILIAAGAGSLWFINNSGLLPEGIQADQIEAVTRQATQIAENPLLIIVPLVERIIALGIQVGLSIVILQAFVRRNWLFVAGAIIYHALFDAVAVIATQQVENVWLVEALLALLAVPLWIWVWRMRPKKTAVSETQKVPVGRGVNLFLISVRKEVKFQWRSKRILIVVAVFLVFGMVSPLLAKFTPQLLGMIEEAEQFADLIPEPSIKDAIGQYIGNITQFGFILVILLGMGAVAHERESGTAAMILSKPLPRSTFIVSKYAAQVLVYSLAFLLATIAGYYYTAFLFGPVSLADFFLANILLLIWLMTFVAMTLFGSVIGRTTGAAAGVGMAGSVIILLAGSIPRYGTLAPSGLLGWVQQMFTTSPVPPNAGSVALSLTLIIILLIAAIGIFEQQEI